LTLFTTNSNLFDHARGTLIYFAMDYAPLSLPYILTILYWYTWLQV